MSLFYYTSDLKRKKTPKRRIAAPDILFIRAKDLPFVRFFSKPAPVDMSSRHKEEPQNTPETISSAERGLLSEAKP